MATEKKPTAKRKVEGRNGGKLSPFEPGVSGNPNGRPKSARYMTELIKEALDGDAEITIEGLAMTDAKAGEKVRIRVKMPTKAQVIQALLRKAASGDNKAIELVLDRVEGKVPLPIGNDPENPLIDALPLNLSADQISKLIDKL